MNIEQAPTYGTIVVHEDGSFTYKPQHPSDLGFVDRIVLSRSVGVLDGTSTNRLSIKITSDVNEINRPKDNIGRAPEICGQPTKAQEVVAVAAESKPPLPHRSVEMPRAPEIANGGPVPAPAPMPPERRVFSSYSP